MSRSTRLFTAAVILSIVAPRAPELVATEEIAEKLQVHPARVRQIVAALVKGGLLRSHRGLRGGLTLAQAPGAITLWHVADAVQDHALLSLGMARPFVDWAAESSLLHPAFVELYASHEAKMREALSNYRLDQLYEKPGSQGEGRAPRKGGARAKRSKVRGSRPRG
jgi:Rrf2 family protein